MILRKGFTVIELLTVSAVVSLLVAAILVSVKSSQLKALDVKVMSYMREIGVVAAMMANDKNSYETLCDTAGTLNDQEPNFPALKILEDEIYNLVLEEPFCYATQNNFCAESLLVTGQDYCVDSLGKAKSNALCSDDNQCVDKTQVGSRGRGKDKGGGKGKK